MIPPKSTSPAIRTGLFLLSFGVFFFVHAGIAYAGFGITPPYLNNDRLTRGTVYEQRITLVRSDPNEDLLTEVTVNVPGAQEWISVDRGLKFILPKGTTQMPIIISVHVPSNAQYKEYKGTMRIRTSTTNVPEGGGVSIALGAQVDVALKVVDKIYDFNVRKIRITDFEEGRTRWGLFFPGKIKFFMTIENTGNTEFGPTKVHFDIYDSEQETLLESTENTNYIEKLKPFTIKEVVAELPTRLPTGSYIAKYTIYKNAEVAQQSQINLSISGIGSIPGSEGYGFDGLSLIDKVKVFVVVGVPLCLIGILIAMVIITRKRRRKTQPHGPWDK